MARKSAKSTRARKRSAGKAAAKKPARSGRTHVNFGFHGMTHIVNAVNEAGLESELNAALGHDDKFVKVQRKSLASIKNFVKSRPELASLAKKIERCDCDPGDPYCIYI